MERVLNGECRFCMGNDARKPAERFKQPDQTVDYYEKHVHTHLSPSNHKLLTKALTTI